MIAQTNGRTDAPKLMAMTGIIAVVSALLVAIISFVILLGLTPITPDETTTLILIIINILFISLLLILILREVQRIVLARKRGKAASRLHVRIIMLFSIVAVVPAILVAIVASVTLDLGLDRWFALRTKVIVNSSLSIAEAYVLENARSLQGTALSMAADLDQNQTAFRIDPYAFNEFMNEQAIGRALVHAQLLRSDGSVVLEANTGRKINLPSPPSAEWLRDADEGAPALIEPGNRNLVGVIIKLRELNDLYLYALREVDAEVIKARQIVRANVSEYLGLEANRVSTQIAFALLYLGVTLVVVLAAIWTGIALADRLVRPIHQLIGAADEVATGNLDVSVRVRASDGDLASLGDTFNKMIHQLKSQRDDLLLATEQIDERRRFSEAVLAGVTAGVIGIDHAGNITTVNKSGEFMLDIVLGEVLGKKLNDILPHIGQVFEAARSLTNPVYREQVTFYRTGAERTFNVQITVEESVDEDHSYIVTIDDITDLVQAQRSTAWADVARRIAHEIKNPLTPIQLAAERIQRRYGRKLTEDRAVFDQCTETIIRQVGDIGRMVDEFSSFARMPKPAMETVDLRDALREATFLVEVSRDEITMERDFADKPLMGNFDNRLMAQAIGNLIKNAAESIDGAMLDDSKLKGTIRVVAFCEKDRIIVKVMDNGRGLPRENRQRLLEPYMTTREKGTGLGLAIVRKIIEDHGGTMELRDAPVDFHDGRGALIYLELPLYSGDYGTSHSKTSDVENQNEQG